MLNKETVQEFLIEAPHHDEQGRISPLPLVGVLMLSVLRKSWLSEKLPEGQVPMVSSGQKVLPNGTEGYSIRKEIVRK